MLTLAMPLVLFSALVLFLLAVVLRAWFTNMVHGSVLVAVLGFGLALGRAAFHAHSVGAHPRFRLLGNWCRSQVNQSPSDSRPMQSNPRKVVSKKAFKQTW